MEIVPVSLFDAVAAEAKPPQGVTPEGPFRDCLGAAMGRKGGSDCQSSPAEKLARPHDPEEALAAGIEAPQGEEISAAEAETKIAEDVETESAEKDGSAPVVILAVPPPPVASGSAPEVLSSATAAGKPAGADAAAEAVASIYPQCPPQEDSGAGPSAPPATQVPGGGEPPISVPEKGGLSMAGPATGEQPVVEPAMDSTPPAESESAGETAATPTPALAMGHPAPAALATQERVAASELPEAAAQARGTSQAEESHAGRARARAHLAFQNRVGAERMWGYWLRTGAVGAQTGNDTAAGAEGGLLGKEAQAGGRPTELQTSAMGWDLVAAADPDSPAPGAGQGVGSEASTERAARTETGTSPVPGAALTQQTERAAPASAVVSRAPPPPPPQPPQQIANAVRIAILQGGDRVTLQLEPETLGKVHVVLMHSEEGVRANFRVESPLTQQALQADTALLKQALEARGVNVAHVSVELEQGDQQTRDPLGRQAQGRRRRLGDGGDDAEMLLDDVGLRPESWRPWGFEARA